jgi:hypothetical protein
MKFNHKSKSIVKKTLFLVACAVGVNFEVFAQGAAGNSAAYETQRIVDMPTAGVLKTKTYSVKVSAYHNGGIMADFNAGIFENFSLGLSYSGTGIIGNDEVTMQKLPGFNAKVRVFNEKRNFPAIVLGFDSQGRGSWLKSKDRFETMSPGAYLAISKNFVWDLGQLAGHFGVNYSFEPAADKRCVNMYGGVEQSIGSNFAINMEYNFCQDEKDYKQLSQLGLLNAALRYSISRGVTIELEFRDLFNHRNDNKNNNLERRFNLEFIKNF